MKGKIKNPVTVRAQKENLKESAGLRAYLVSKDGALLESVPFKTGEAQFKTSSQEIRGNTKIYIGAPVPSEIGNREVTEKLLLKMGAWQPSVGIDSSNIALLPPFPPVLISPLFKRCHITGSLTKSFIIDGVSQVLPVCNARVHICEVDPIRILWPLIPDLVITDLWRRLKEVTRVRIPIPIPDPPPFERGPIPFPEPGPDPAPFFNVQADETLNLSKRRSAIINAPASLPAFPQHVQNAIASDSLSAFSDVLKKHFHLFHPYLCLWPWYWPYFYKCDPIATVTTDCNGRFDYNMLYFLFGDHPDIYIWVEVLVNGQWVTVYHPRIACNTYWNYACGSDINIRITDPRVRPCDCAPLPGSIVWMKRVNTGVSIRRIQQNNNAAAHLSNAIGLTAFATSQNVSPFGKEFPLVVQFGSGFPNGTVTHYRWKLRKLKDAYLQNDLGSVETIQGDISKPYTYEVSTPGGTVFATGSFPLGPTYNNGLPKYKIPHVEASDDVPEPTAEWNQDTASINVSTQNFSDGLYEFVFELLNNAGNIVPLPANTFVVDRLASDPAGPSTIVADGLPENYVVKNAAGLALGFRFVMRIDNAVCYADVLDALVDGNTTDTECGFGHYNNKASDVATLRFLAGQPHDFATYGFHVTKGNSNPVPAANSSGYVTQVNNGYAVIPILVGGVLKDKYQKNVAVSTMLGTCTMAAFAENLYVYATHTNGSRRLNEYDRPDTAAIAIAPV